MSEMPQINPNALTPADVAMLLSRVSGHQVEVSEIEADIEAGAPVNHDGTIHLVHWTAWLHEQS